MADNLQRTDVFGYNMSMEFLKAQNKAFDFTEAKTIDLIATLTTLNNQNRDLQRLSAALTHAKKDKRDADFTEENEKKQADHEMRLKLQEMREAVFRIHETDPHVLGDSTNILLYKFDQIEDILSVIDGKIKDQASKINETTMYIQQNYQDRIQFTENAQKTLEMLIRHVDSILSKIRT